MKRLLCLLLCIALLCCGCQMASDLETPFRFYYRRAQADFSSREGVLAPETVDLGAEPLTLDALVNRYLRGPASEDLLLPFPKGTVCSGAQIQGSTAMVELTAPAAAQSEINASVADVCLTETLLQMSQIEHVQIVIYDQNGEVQHRVQLSSDDIILYDDSSDTSSTTIVLYFTDESHRYLLAEKRTVPYADVNASAQAVVEQLLAGPKNPGLLPTMPEGTLLLDLNVENGICAVDFNRDFVNNRPETELAERMTLLSLVNSLTDLEEVSTVHIYVEGRRLEQYFLLDASYLESQDVRAIGPVRTDLSELDVSAYFCFQGDGLLHLAPVRIRYGNHETSAEAVVRTLTEYAPVNGCINPLYQAEIRSVTVFSDHCTVDFLGAPSFGDGQEGIRSLVATLTTLEGIRAVQIMVNGVPVQNDAERLWTPDPGWYCGQ